MSHKEIFLSALKPMEQLCIEFDKRVEEVGLFVARFELVKAIVRLESVYGFTFSVKSDDINNIRLEVPWVYESDK